MKYSLMDLAPIFRKIFQDENIQLKESTTAADIEDWDSVNHIYLVVAIEKHFKVKFTTYQIQSWKNVGEILATLNTLAK